MSFRKTISVLACALLASNPASALNILLTNDDGFEHPWIRTLQTVLTAAGHEVTMVAPDVNQSGQSAALTLGAIRNSADALQQHAPQVYSVKGSPATAAILGVKDVLKNRPDLIVSGINDGANIGVISAFSGTVGATVAALHLMGEPIPAIAISSNLLDPQSTAESADNLRHATDISEFVARLISRLDSEANKQGSAILPYGIALNVNYPAVAHDQVQGVGIYQHGRDIGVNFSDKGALPQLQAGAEAKQDTTALRAGFITVVPIDGDYTARDWQHIFPETLLKDLAR